MYALTFSQDGELLATGAADRTVRIWRRDGTLVAKIADLPKDMLSIAFSPDGKTLATAGWDHFVSLWDLDGKLPQPGEESYDIIYDPDEKIIAGDSFEGQAPQRLEGHKGWIHEVIYSPDGETIATADGTANLWSAQGEFLKSLEGHQDGVVALQFSHDNQLIATGSYDHTVKIWSLEGNLLTTLRGHTDRVTNLSISSDKSLLATVGEDDRLLLWDLDIQGGQAQLLTKLLDQSCQWLENYLQNHNNQQDIEDNSLTEIQAYCDQPTVASRVTP